MKQIVYHEIGNPAEVLCVEEHASPALQEGEARVEVLATPIHPSDLLTISGEYGQLPDLPSTPGSEGTGRVIEIYPGVEQLAKGQIVMLPATEGTWCQEIVASASAFTPLPSGVDIQQLAMLTVNPITAYLLLNKFANLKAGDWLVQSAANSAVGTYVNQLARQRGIRTVNIVRRENVVEDVKNAGGEIVLVDGESLAEQVVKATQNAQIMLAIDAVGGTTFTRMVEMLSSSGVIACYGALSTQLSQLSNASIIFRDIRVRGFWLSSWFQSATMDEKQSAFSAIISAISSGTLKSSIDATFSLDQISDAVVRAAVPYRSGKVLLLPKPF